MLNELFDTNEKPNVILVAGPNGAGKSTTASALISNLAPFSNYLNPDLIARGIAPLDPSSVSFAAGRIMRDRIRELVATQESFAFETALSGRTYAKLLDQMEASGYQVNLLFLWLKSADLAVQRVASRVRGGGHNIMENDIRRRYEMGITNFFNLYRKRAHAWRLYDNSDQQPMLIAAENNDRLAVKNMELWQHLKERYSLNNDNGNTNT